MKNTKVTKIAETPQALAVKSKPTANPLQKLVDQETENRVILTKFITDHMAVGVDFGRIHISRNCDNKYNTSLCKIPGHWSKDCLFKPGSEKFASLMKLVPRFKKDTDTWEMAGSKFGLICYICELIDSKGVVRGEGRGSADLSEKAWSMNNAIKIAEKRAQIDAVLRTGGLSDFFTQDLDDMSQPQSSTTPHLSPKNNVQAPLHASEDTYKATPRQLNYIKGLLSKKGYSEKELMTKYELLQMDELMGDQASTIIANLLKLPDVPQHIPQPEEQIVPTGNLNEQQEPVVNMDDIPEFE